MAVLVSDYVALRERTALRAESLLQLLEEAQVEVHLLVFGAVEGTHRGLRQTARALSVSGVDHGLRGQVRLAAPRELVAPILLDAVDEAHDAAVATAVRPRAAPPLPQP